MTGDPPGGTGKSPGSTGRNRPGSANNPVRQGGDSAHSRNRNFPAGGAEPAGLQLNNRRKTGPEWGIGVQNRPVFCHSGPLDKGELLTGPLFTQYEDLPSPFDLAFLLQLLAWGHVIVSCPAYARSERCLVKGRIHDPVSLPFDRVLGHPRRRNQGILPGLADRIGNVRIFRFHGRSLSFDCCG